MRLPFALSGTECHPCLTVSSQSAVSSYVTVGERLADRIDTDPTALETVSHHTYTSLVTFRSKAPGVETTSCLKVRWQNTTLSPVLNPCSMDYAIIFK